MRKSITTIILLFCFCAFSQKEVSKKVSTLIANNTTFNPYSVLTVSNQTSDLSLDKALKKATVAKINWQSLSRLVASKEETIEVSIPYQEEVITVQLYKVNILAEGFHIDTNQARSIPYEQGVYYRGIIKGDLNSTVSFNFFKDELNGIIANPTFGNLVIGKINKKDNRTDYVIYSESDLTAQNTIECHTKDGVVQPYLNTQKPTQKRIDRCVTMYFEIDYNLFLDNGSNTTTTSNWMTSVFNNVQTLYSNDGITISLKSLYIWTTLDPYEGLGNTVDPPSSEPYLYKFNEVRPVFDGDVGQLIGNDNGAFGGLAITIGGLCSTNNFSYSDVEFAYKTVPTYSWTVLVIAHEMGHLLGSQHTHTCAWNGNDTAIDGCGPTANVKYKEGTCDIGPIPSTTVKGTIMSYCHLISGVGMNLANGFGPQPAARILSTVNGSSCLSTDCINTCINTVSEITIDAVTNTSAAFSWTDLGDTSSWQVAVTPFGSSSVVWSSPLLVKNYSITGLSPNTYYLIRVRPTCASGLTPVNRQTVLVTTANYCNGVTITDTGGVINNYSNLETYVRTIIPSNSNQKIRLTFSSFDLEQDFDYLYVYDGNSTSATELGSGYTGTTLPGPFESTAVDGSLTMKFFSDTYEVGAGYVATIDCVSNLGNNQFLPNIDFTYYPNPSKGFVAITSKTAIKEVLVYNLQGRLLYQKAINSLDTKVDMASFASGTYFFKLKFNEKEAHFKIVKM